ncbi:D-glycero-D-manno-heptose 1,7-bisphosphate phosphatase [Tistlia consotensis]|uniref:D,D-heptose 1,7-bisphosphate phosphatase n=1 Tax=Tistlia consotensis USBA 355 TaxID=560819 RepID=A0A1Y6C0Z7_9PROT|nr:HAD-IIIA family hydrolase [Tistlia consotensis]SMF38197.1 D-glycero-D-manno-heptose 1,7-bisphosphate phosphatase [Tistlia consotensis USBA 355]SNR37335.1 D-glycero-D-manno-heptose 1,7-bisphosphate phosphatase [Tistlia consotensis]
MSEGATHGGLASETGEIPRSLQPDGLWCERRRQVPPPSPRALFLDRDGVVVEEVGFLHRPQEVRLAAGAAALCRAARAAGWTVVLVTNQSGIGRGRYGWPEFAATQAEIERQLAAAGAPEPFDLVLACPHHPEGIEPYRHADAPGRKPNPGMLARAIELLALEPAASWIVGDRAVDLEAGRRAGLAGGLHLSTGHGRDAGEREQALASATPAYRVLAADDLPAALTLLPLSGG